MTRVSQWEYSPADVVSEARLGVVAGGEVLGVLPPVLVRAPGGLVVHHPVSTPAPASSRQTDALLGTAVETRLVRPHVPEVGVKFLLLHYFHWDALYLSVGKPELENPVNGFHLWFS